MGGVRCLRFDHDFKEWMQETVTRLRGEEFARQPVRLFGCCVVVTVFSLLSQVPDARRGRLDITAAQCRTPGRWDGLSGFARALSLHGTVPGRFAVRFLHGPLLRVGCHCTVPPSPFGDGDGARPRRPRPRLSAPLGRLRPRTVAAEPRSERVRSEERERERGGGTGQS